MGIDENEAGESAPRGENTLGVGPWEPRHWGSTLGILIAALLVVEVSKDVLFSTYCGDRLPVYKLLFYCVIAGLPFLLARMAPRAAGFDTQWLPGLSKTP